MDEAGDCVRAPQVVLFAPNLVGYGRLVLLGAAACTGAQTRHAALCTYWLFLSNFILDGVDGLLARRLCQARHCSCSRAAAVRVLRDL